MAATREVRFGIGLETDVVQVGELLAHARFADQAGLDLVSLTDHPYFAERIDAYAALAFVLGTTENVAAAVIMTNLLSRPAPILARTAVGLSTISQGRFLLGIGAGGLEEEIVALGVPRLSPAARVRTLEEAITVVRSLSGGGDPVTFDGEFHQVTELAPSVAPAPPIWVGALGPRRWRWPGDKPTGGSPGIWPTGAARWWPNRGRSSMRPRVAAGRDPGAAILGGLALDSAFTLWEAPGGWSTVSGRLRILRGVSLKGPGELVAHPGVDVVAIAIKVPEHDALIGAAL